MGNICTRNRNAIKDLDFTGKIVRIVTTHEGSGLANVVNDIKRICNGATILDDAIAITGSKVKDSKEIIESWVG